MREEMYEIYRDLYDRYRLLMRDDRWNYSVGLRGGWVADRLLQRWITEAIEQAAGDLGVTRRLRPDARLFLLINLHQMVAAPLAASELAQTLLLELQEMLFQDARTIIAQARTDRPNQEISGNEILRATSKVLDDLSLSRFELWG